MHTTLHILPLYAEKYCLRIHFSMRKRGHVHCWRREKNVECGGDAVRFWRTALYGSSTIITSLTLLSILLSILTTIVIVSPHSPQTHLPPPLPLSLTQLLLSTS